MSEFDISKVMEFLPHRYPFLLIDRVLETDESGYLNALKNVTINEPFFQGHFPEQPIMPGVLVLEALAQATGLLAFSSMGDGHESKLYMLVGIDKARFRGQVVPGDQLSLNVRLKRNMRGIGQYQCQALVGGRLVVEAEMMCSAQDRTP
ncbi:MAG: 3-hydroxyacyl-ACP dehydratase FabZ [Gammaproteobacteria bacterium]|nr:3-hydroxyacyl-ACP dehydratase FabZ [Gammaproteobacteria bacterium]